MKIGVITFWQSNDNYGQQLQCWALQQQLMQMGHNPFLIRFVPIYPHRPAKSTKEKILSIVKLYPIIDIVSEKINFYKRKKQIEKNRILDKQRQFAQFREHHLSVSKEEYLGIDSLIKNAPSADIYICGSDQVWNLPLSNREHRAFFLDFGNSQIRRVAYAPSFGMDNYPEDNQYELKTLLQRFNAISVREPSGVDICKKIGLNAKVVLDPTLLLDTSIYKRLLRGYERDDEDYIFIYSLNMISKEDVSWNNLKEFSKRHKYNINVTPATGYSDSAQIFNKKDVKYLYATIPEWIALIANAKMMITSSFHGIVFSIIMHTPFVFVPVKGKGAVGNGRVISLLCKLGLSNRISNGLIDYDKFEHETINWDSVARHLNESRIESIDYLSKAIKI